MDSVFLDAINRFWPELIATLSLALIASFRKIITRQIGNLFRWCNERCFRIFRACPAEAMSRDIANKLESIQSQLVSNGGTSLRDAINRIDHNVTQVVERVTVLQADTELQSDVLGLAQFKTNDIGELTYCNRSFMKLFGLVGKDALGNGWTNTIDLKDRDVQFDKWKAAVEKRVEFVTEHYITNQITKERHYVYAKATPVYKKTGELIGWTGIIRPEIEYEEINEDIPVSEEYSEV